MSPFDLPSIPPKRRANNTGQSKIRGAGDKGARNMLKMCLLGGQKEEKLLPVFPGNLTIFRWGEDNIEIFIRLLHMVLFPRKFLEVVVIGFQLMKFLPVLFNTFNIVFSVDFELVQLSHFLIPGN